MVATRARRSAGRDDTPSEWLSTREVADYLGCTVDWLYHLGAAGVGPPRRQLGGKRWKYLRRDVDEWVLSEPDLSAASERQRQWKQRLTEEQAQERNVQRRRRRSGAG